MSPGVQTSGQDDHLPPPYTLEPAERGRPSIRAFHDSLNPGHPQPSSSSLFSAQLSDLRSQILQQQAARSSARERHDHEMLSELVPHTEALLDSIAAMNPPPSVVEATLVPDSAIDKSWTLSDNEGKKSGHLTRLLRVGQHPRIEGEKKRPSAISESPDTASEVKEFDEWGRWEDGSDKDENDLGAGLWWLDEGMARRLASYLQPTPNTTSVDRQTVRPEAKPSREARKPRLSSFFNKHTPSSATASTPSQSSGKETAQPSASPDLIGMSVDAEETSFRRQNEMGIWESRTGWGLVVRVTIRT